MCKTNFWFELWISLFLALLCMIWHTECQIANGNMLSGAGKRDVLVKHVWSCSDGQDPFQPQLLLREWLYWELVSNSDKKWSKNYVSLIGNFSQRQSKVKMVKIQNPDFSYHWGQDLTCLTSMSYFPAPDNILPFALWHFVCQIMQSSVWV